MLLTAFTQEPQVMLGSIFRIDEDYSARWYLLLILVGDSDKYHHCNYHYHLTMRSWLSRKLALNILNVEEEHLDYYEWER